MDVESGVYVLLLIVAAGVALVILTGVNYTNYSSSRTQLIATANVATGCQTTNSLEANYCLTTGIGANFTANGGAIANTAGSNANYVYYILFMALVIAVVIGVLVAAVKHNKK